jgi:ubiquinone/menaquinone biosynthesis C-methylase UbiE
VKERRASTRGNGLLERSLARLRARKARSLISSDLANGRILDLGCGHYPLFLESVSFRQKVAIDLEPGIEANKSSVQVIKFDLSSSASLPFRSQSFAAVTMLAVFEHLAEKSVRALLDEIYRILDPGGVFIMTTPASWTDGILTSMARLGLVSRTEILDHKKTYSSSEIYSLIDTSEFAFGKVLHGRFEMGANLWFACRKQPRSSLTASEAGSSDHSHMLMMTEKAL